MKMSSSLYVACLALALSPVVANARDGAAENSLSGSAAIGVAAIPTYEGAGDHRVLPLVNGRLELANRYLALEGTSLRANVLGSASVEFGPVANLTFGRSSDIDSAAVARLGQIDDAFELGAFAAINLRLASTQKVRLAIQGVRDISGVHRGTVVSGSAGYFASIGSRATISFDLGASYASNSYARTYFSVGTMGSIASGLPVYGAKAGLKDMGGSVTASYRIGKKWSAIGYAGYRRLLGAFADSPIVNQAGKADQISGGIGVLYAF